MGRVIRTVPRRNKVSHAVTIEMVNARVETTTLIAGGMPKSVDPKSNDSQQPIGAALKINKFACANLRLLHSNPMAGFFL